MASEGTGAREVRRSMPRGRSAGRRDADEGASRMRTNRMTVDFSDEEIAVLREVATHERLTVSDLLRASAVLLRSGHRDAVVEAAIRTRQ